MCGYPERDYDPKLDDPDYTNTLHETAKLCAWVVIILLSAFLVTIFIGCSPAPVEPIKVTAPAMEDYEPVLALAMSDTLGTPSVKPNPTPTPTPAPILKVGDTCPFCKPPGSGWSSTDSVVKVPCWQCNGDGKLDAGDPALTPAQEVHNAFENDAPESQHDILLSRSDSIELLGRINAYAANIKDFLSKLPEPVDVENLEALKDTRERLEKLRDGLDSSPGETSPEKTKEQLDSIQEGIKKMNEQGKEIGKETSRTKTVFFMLDGEEYLFNPIVKAFVSPSGKMIRYPYSHVNNDINHLILSPSRVRVELQRR